MVITIVVLAVLLTISLLACVFLYQVLKSVVLDSAIDTGPQLTDVFHASALVGIQFDAQFDGISYDFSKYEDTGLVGIMTYYKRPAKSDKERNADMPVYMEDVVISAFSDGTMLCKFF